MTCKLVSSLGIAVGLFVTSTARADDFPTVSLSAMTVGVLGPTEAFYEKGGPGWLRNMWGAGLGVDAGRAASVDAYWLRQDDGKRPSPLLLLMLTVHLL